MLIEQTLAANAILLENGVGTELQRIQRRDAAGIVSWIRTHGRPGPNKRARIVRRDKDYLIEFDDEDKVERISSSAGRLRIEHFTPKRKYREGETPIVGTGAKQ